MSEDGVRLDKWLWASRFFKTRSLAKKAITGGNIKIDGSRCRPSRQVQTGQQLSIRKGDNTFVVEVLGLSEKRGKASIAEQLYREDDAAKAARLAAAEQRRLVFAATPVPNGRPDKHDRRTLRHLKQQQD